MNINRCTREFVNCVSDNIINVSEFNQQVLSGVLHMINNTPEFEVYSKVLKTYLPKTYQALSKGARKQVKIKYLRNSKTSQKKGSLKKKKYSKGKKKSKKKSKKLSKKSSYRLYLSKRLKEVKKAHPSWPQSKVFKEAVKGWKSSK